MTITYTQDEVEATQMVETAEGWLEHYNGNITRCAEALGLSNATLRKHRDNNTLSQFLVYSGKVYMYKNDIYPISNTPSEAEWELIPPERANAVTTFDKQLNIVLKPNIKITRDQSTGRVQYWKKGKKD